MKLEQTNLDIAEYGKGYKFYYNKDVNLIICTAIYKDQTVRGVARCNPDDKFDFDLGKKLSYLRCKRKLAKKKVKRALDVEKDAIVKMDMANNKLRKAYRFVVDAKEQLDDATKELREFEEKING